MYHPLPLSLSQPSTPQSTLHLFFLVSYFHTVSIAFLFCSCAILVSLELYHLPVKNNLNNLTAFDSFLLSFLSYSCVTPPSHFHFNRVSLLFSFIVSFPLHQAFFTSYENLYLPPFLSTPFPFLRLYLNICSITASSFLVFILKLRILFNLHLSFSLFAPRLFSEVSLLVHTRMGLEFL